MARRQRQTFRQKALRAAAEIRTGFMPRWWFDKNDAARRRLRRHDEFLRGNLNTTYRVLDLEDVRAQLEATPAARVVIVSGAYT